MTRLKEVRNWMDWIVSFVYETRKRLEFKQTKKDERNVPSYLKKKEKRLIRKRKTQLHGELYWNDQFYKKKFLFPNKILTTNDKEKNKTRSRWMKKRKMMQMQILI